LPIFNPSGWYIEGAYFILPKKLQAVIKWEELSPDQVADDGIRSITAGLNYYIHACNQGDGKLRAHLSIFALPILSLATTSSMKYSAFAGDF